MPLTSKKLLISFSAYLLASLILFVGCSEDPTELETSFPSTFRPERHAAADPQRCAKCHEQQHADWRESHHALANRKLDPSIDRDAFSATLADEEKSGIQPVAKQGALSMPGPRPGDDLVEAEGVLGYHPLRQYLVESEGGRLQAHSLAYDPDRNEWFDIFGNDGRHAGEWGHWSGQGMNWNSNCAWCHMTEFDSNYDIASNSYQSEWTAQGVSCLQCHSQAIEHAEAVESGKGYLSANPYQKTKTQTAMENCATCHSRREDISHGEFVAGDSYSDHYRLALPDREGLYFPDFKARDEDYVYASLQLSSMGHAGVTCMDCHNPHSGGFVAPRENNLLCLQCHSTGKLDAPLIIPTAHSKHAAESTGNNCIECHMPTRTYMARDPRHDHGFTIPDPQLTLEQGVPNACNQCHEDQSVEWAAKAFEQWYPTPTVKARRDHARMMARAWDPAQPFPTKEILAAYEETENPYRQATYVQLLANAGHQFSILDTQENPLESASPILRSAAVRLLANDPTKIDLLRDQLNDPKRMVRLAAGQSLQGSTPQIANDTVDLRKYIESNADRPHVRLQLAQESSLAGDSQAAFRHAQVAVSFDPSNPQVYYQGAIALASGGHLSSAQVFLGTAPEEATNDGWIDYATGLLWAEKNELARSIEAMKEAVSKNPAQERWWYNLVVAHMQSGNNTAAQSTLRRALAQHPDSPSLRSLLPQSQP